MTSIHIRESQFAMEGAFCRRNAAGAEHLALVAWWMGGFVLCFGIASFRRALFPLCFLLWLVPLPQTWLDPIVNLLQRGSAASARFLFAVCRLSDQ